MTPKRLPPVICSHLHSPPTSASCSSGDWACPPSAELTSRCSAEGYSCALSLLSLIPSSAFLLFMCVHIDRPCFLPTSLVSSPDDLRSFGSGGSGSAGSTIVLTRPKPFVHTANKLIAANTATTTHHAYLSVRPVATACMMGGQTAPPLIAAAIPALASFVLRPSPL